MQATVYRPYFHGRQTVSLESDNLDGYILQFNFVFIE